MVFTEIDAQTMRSLCTLVKLSKDKGIDDEIIINIGQQMGVPKEDTLEVINEWEEQDTIHLQSEKDKKRFISRCFSHLDGPYHPDQSEVKFYQLVKHQLGLETRFNNN